MLKVFYDHIIVKGYTRLLPQIENNGSLEERATIVNIT